jgi:hypothetical protein
VHQPCDATQQIRALHDRAGRGASCQSNGNCMDYSPSALLCRAWRPPRPCTHPPARTPAHHKRTRTTHPTRLPQAVPTHCKSCARPLHPHARVRHITAPLLRTPAASATTTRVPTRPLDHLPVRRTPTAAHQPAVCPSGAWAVHTGGERMSDDSSSDFLSHAPRWALAGCSLVALGAHIVRNDAHNLI